MRWDAITEEARCWSCGKQDDPPPWARVCFECGHTWKTVADLVRHDFRERFARDPNAEVRGSDEIIVCPCCAHDFWP